MSRPSDITSDPSEWVPIYLGPPGLDGDLEPTTWGHKVHHDIFSDDGGLTWYSIHDRCLKCEIRRRVETLKSAAKFVVHIPFYIWRFRD